MPNISFQQSLVLTGLYITMLTAFPIAAVSQEAPEAEEKPPTVILRPLPSTQQRALQVNPQIEIQETVPVKPKSRGLTAIPTENVRAHTESNHETNDLTVRQNNDWELIAKRSSSVEGTSWLDLEIPVCWESMQADYAEGRAWVEDAIENSWDKATDIDFIGWEGCNEDSRGIRIDVREAGPQVADLGRNLDGLPNGMTLNFTFQSWGLECGLTEGNREFCIRTLAVHEFGHALGLAHEDLRNDARVERNLCWAEAQGPNATFYITSYDPNSVMNYCSPDWNNNGNLTALDIAGARMIYGPFNEDTPATMSANISMGFFSANGSYETPPNLQEAFALTRATPLEVKPISVCSDDNHLLEMQLSAELRPDTTQIAVSGKFDLFTASENCAVKMERVAEDYVEAVLVEPKTNGAPFLVKLQPVSKTLNHVAVSLDMVRTLGSEVIVETCETCAAASAEAVFAVPATTSPEEPTPAPSRVAASPWPSDFKLDLEVCAREVKSGPNFGGIPWSDANIERLCKATPTSKAPAQCFAKIMTEGLDFGDGSNWAPDNALSLCAGSDNSDATIACFSDKIASGQALSSAIEACAAP